MVKTWGGLAVVHLKSVNDIWFQPTHMLQIQMTAVVEAMMGALRVRFQRISG